MKRIGIVIVCTNSYFVLGIRVVKKFMKHYTGTHDIQFYLFTDTDPAQYTPNLSNVHYINRVHADWVEGTNSKYKDVVTLETENLDYIYYFDADTNISRDFTEEWFLGDLVGGQHYGDLGHMVVEGRPFDRNPQSKAYVPEDTPLSQMYYYGAFWGGAKDRVISLCKLMYDNQLEDRKIGYEPRWNDESYLNQYYHYNPPTFVVASNKFEFDISNKGGITHTRDSKKDIDQIKKDILSRPNDIFEIYNGKVVF
jgi:hypothetical protein